MFNNIKQLFLFVFVGLIAVSCDNDSNPAGPTVEDGLMVFGHSETVAIITVEDHAHEEEGDEDEHADIGGLQLEEDGATTYTYKQVGFEIEGLITLTVGEVKEFSLHFLDSNGEELHDEEHCEDLNQTECGTSDHCEWHNSACEEAHEGEEAHEDEHGMHIEIEGVSVGTTQFVVSLMHNGHSDYTSYGIPITVIAVD